jgi:hypothetical protein
MAFGQKLVLLTWLRIEVVIGYTNIVLVGLVMSNRVDCTVNGMNGGGQ